MFPKCLRRVEKNITCRIVVYLKPHVNHFWRLNMILNDNGEHHADRHLLVTPVKCSLANQGAELLFQSLEQKDIEMIRKFTN